jgi:hypothetical protein
VYADACMLAFEDSGQPELLLLATQVRDARCQPWDVRPSGIGTGLSNEHTR